MDAQISNPSSDTQPSQASQPEINLINPEVNPVDSIDPVDNTNPSEESSAPQALISITPIAPTTVTVNNFNNVTTGDTTPRFEWSVVSPDGSATRFEIYLGASATSMEYFAETRNSFYEIPKARALFAGEKEWDNTSYFWKIVALNEGGEVVGESASANFTVVKSLVGQDTLAKGIYLHDSGGNPVFTLRENQSPATYGGGWENVPNGCLPDGYGFADFGTFNGVDNIIEHTRNHSYRLDFDDTLNIQDFSLQMSDWGDYLPYGKNADGVYGVSMYAYNSNNQLIDQDTISFTSSEGGLSRNNAEFRHTRMSGDVCMAEPGEPGKYTFHVTGDRISYVELRFKDRASMDPNIGFRFPRINGVSVHMAKIKGTFFLDYDYDNVRDANEPGVSNLSTSLKTEIQQRDLVTIDTPKTGYFETEIDGVNLNLTLDETDQDIPAGYRYVGPTQFTLREAVDNDLGDLPFITGNPVVTVQNPPVSEGTVLGASTTRTTVAANATTSTQMPSRVLGASTLSPTGVSLETILGGAVMILAFGVYMLTKATKISFN